MTQEGQANPGYTADYRAAAHAAVRFMGLSVGYRKMARDLPWNGAYYTREAARLKIEAHEHLAWARRLKAMAVAA